MQHKLAAASTGCVGLLLAVLIVRLGFASPAVPQAHAAVPGSPRSASPAPAATPNPLTGNGSSEQSIRAYPARPVVPAPALAGIRPPQSDAPAKPTPAGTAAANASRVGASQAASANAGKAPGNQAAKAPVNGPHPAAINGLPAGKIVVLSPGTPEHVRQIFAQGRQLGRNARAFAKIGDSTMAYPALLSAFADRQDYNLGPYAYLQDTIDALTGSFARSSAAVKKGMHTWSEFDPQWVARPDCGPGEGPLACELRLSNASTALIRLGANDAAMPAEYEKYMRQILAYCLANGVIPIVGTKPDRSEGSSNAINGIVYKLAAEYNIPLWDYDLVAATVPGKGLESDQIHFLPGDTHDFSAPRAFAQGAPLEDLSALIALDTVRALVADN